MMKSKFISGFVLTLALLPLLSRGQSVDDDVQDASDATEDSRLDDQEDPFTTWKINDLLKDHTVVESFIQSTSEDYDTDLSSVSETIIDQNDDELIEIPTLSPYNYSEVNKLSNKSEELSEESELLRSEEESGKDTPFPNEQNKISKPLQISEVVKPSNKSEEVSDESELRSEEESGKDSAFPNEHKKISKPLQMRYDKSEGNHVTAAMFFTGLLVWFTAVGFILD